MWRVFSTPSPAKLVPSPYKQGESAIRTFNSSHRVSLPINNSPRMDYYLLPTTYYLLLTTYSPFYTMLSFQNKQRI